MFNRAELVNRMRALTVSQSTRDWIALLEQHAVPCGPINTVRDVFEDPQVRARQMQLAMRHPRAGEVPIVASPIRLSGTPVQYRAAPPQLGQHTGDVLARHLGLSPQEIENLIQLGVLA